MSHMMFASGAKRPVTIDEATRNSLVALAQEFGVIMERIGGSDDEPQEHAALHPLVATKDVARVAKLRAIIALRRARAEVFGADLFADPAWDILLDLLLAELTQARATVGSACAAASVPDTTALRWIGLLESNGFLERRKDPHDGRRVFVNLTDRARTALHALLDQHERGIF